ncbi:MAG: hypothetical protein E7538_01935 [Ruminococcaceae bacterium]|nr:hypothetical protein [Oscillospiraceae bacterium]
MDFFDSLIADFTDLCSGLERKSFPYSDKTDWPEKDYSEVILQRDTAGELDGVGFNLITHKSVDDEIVLIGDDIKEISSKRRFARVTVVQLENTDDEQKLYNLIRKVEYVKYHFFPEGYMIRTASRAHKEAVRISKSAVKRGLSFEKIGNALISRYKENPAVKGVRVYFITEPQADFSKIEAVAQKNNGITETLNHILNSVKFDCDSCNLKPICDEVEGMKELHFKNMQMGS